MHQSLAHAPISTRRMASTSWCGPLSPPLLAATAAFFFFVAGLRGCFGLLRPARGEAGVQRRRCSLPRIDSRSCGKNLLSGRLRDALDPDEQRAPAAAHAPQYGPHECPEVARAQRAEPREESGDAEGAMEAQAREGAEDRTRACGRGHDAGIRTKESGCWRDLWREVAWQGGLYVRIGNLPRSVCMGDGGRPWRFSPVSALMRTRAALCPLGPSASGARAPVAKGIFKVAVRSCTEEGAREPIRAYKSPITSKRSGEAVGGGEQCVCGERFGPVQIK